jgi:hypothetical protein
MLGSNCAASRWANGTPGQRREVPQAADAAVDRAHRAARARPPAHSLLSRASCRSAAAADPTRNVGCDTSTIEPGVPVAGVNLNA